VVAWGGIQKTSAARVITHFRQFVIFWIHPGVHQTDQRQIGNSCFEPQTSGCRTRLSALLQTTPSADVTPMRVVAVRSGT
jgi:hypothetical protein